MNRLMHHVDCADVVGDDTGVGCDPDPDPEPGDGVGDGVGVGVDRVGFGVGVGDGGVVAVGGGSASCARWKTSWNSLYDGVDDVFRFSCVVAGFKLRMR